MGVSQVRGGVSQVRGGGELGEGGEPSEGWG